MSEEEKKNLFEYIIKNQYSLTYTLAKSSEIIPPNDKNLKGRNIKD